MVGAKTHPLSLDGYQVPTRQFYEWAVAVDGQPLAKRMNPAPDCLRPVAGKRADQD
jgi:hypothetical protein